MVTFGDDRFGYMVLNELYRLGIRSGFLGFNGEFKEQELSQVRSLTVLDCCPLKDLLYLPNLECLKIYRDFSFTMSKEEDFLYPAYDFSVIRQLPFLKKLYIINEPGIRSLDVSDLLDLKEVILINNPHLRYLKVGNHQRFERLVILGNHFQFTPDLLGSIGTRTVGVLDYLLYPAILSNPKHLRHIMNSDLRFAEKIGFGELKMYSFEEMDALDVAARQIVKENCSTTMSKWNMIKVLNHFVATNVEYDTESLLKREEYFQQHLYHPFLESEEMEEFRLINTSYRALLSRRAVCEGYANMLKYLLRLVSTWSETIYTHVGPDPLTHYDHACLCFFYRGQKLYCDPQLENMGGNFFGLSQDEFEKTHQLSIFDSIKVKNMRR